jgi:hypothetical protein
MKPKGYWTYENCVNEVKKYKTYNELKKNSSSAYTTIIKNKWTDIFKKYFTYSKKAPNNFWTKEKCEDIAKNYEYRSDFKKGNNKCYSAAQSNDWLNEICKHMQPKSTPYKRIVYQYEFSNNTYYVGLTCLPKKRNKFHLENEKSEVYKYFKLKKLKPEYKVISNGFIDYQEASKLEYETIEKYKFHGFQVLNKVKGGSLGGGFCKWDREQCLLIATKCKNISEFIINHSGAYNYAKKTNLLVDIKTLFKSERKEMGYWTYEKCKNEAKKYKYKSDFQKSSPSVYVISSNKNWINEICTHMTKKQGSEFKSKKVSQYSLSGELIKVWDSIKDAKNELKINHISDVCNNKIKSSGNYYWRYFENN